MSQQPELMVWPGGEHEFKLAAIGQLKALEQSRDSGPFEIYKRLADGTFRMDDILEVVRLGLVGGGMDSGEARKKVNGALDIAGLDAMRVIAIRILNNTLWWDAKGDEPGESKAGGEETPIPTRPYQTEELGGQNTTQSAQ